MKIRHPWLVAIAAWFIAQVIRTWMRTIRFRYAPSGPDYEPANLRDGERYIYAFWHEHILVPASRYARPDIWVLISKHADGQMISSACRQLGFQTVAGSSTRGGAEAVREMVSLGKVAHLAITPDGPRGPRREMQQGAAFLASKTGLPVVPFGVACSCAHRFGSWDRFMLPWPFSRVVLVTGQAVVVPENLDREGLEAWRQTLEAELESANRMAEDILEGKITAEDHGRRAA
ncbi:MAG: lysophospholipid acyltransferase family protein [Planctomycetes bacterium]|nr:lysophospholipid acyltransferase family protein [Planctomycetota bacterium]